MKTNLKTQTYFVLTNEDDKILAIMNCHAGIEDISENLEQAICDEYDAAEVVINAVLINGVETLRTIEEYDYNITFKADIICEGFDTDTETFSLTRTEIY